MIDKILKEVKSPFTDELIKNLIEKFIECGCDVNELYILINHTENTDKTINSDVERYINQIYSQGVYKGELWNHPNKDEVDLVYESDNNWIILSSGEDPMDEMKQNKSRRYPLVYRIYINLKEKEKVEFVDNYIKKFQQSRVPFELKFSIDDSRLDQIIILSRTENLEENILAVEELTKDYEYGELPLLVGKYKDRIGITEEYYHRLYSPTLIRLDLVKTSIKKYLCDHIDEFEEKLSDDEKGIIKSYKKTFDFIYKDEIEDIEEFGDEYEDIGKKYYQEKSTIDCAKEYIEDNGDAYTTLDGLDSAIKQIYLNNPEQFTEEIIKNYRMIGTQVWGFSKDFVFSNETEEKFLKSKENDSISAEQIGLTMKSISRKGLIDEVQADLISMVENKDKNKEKEQ